MIKPKPRVEIPFRAMHREKTIVFFHMPDLDGVKRDPVIYKGCPIPREGEKVDLDHDPLEPNSGGLVVTKVWYRFPSNTVHVDLREP